MPKCPICSTELSEHGDEGWLCVECNEIIPKKYAKESKIPCCDPFSDCK